jgi:ABC-type transport system involved in cytochrome c biogenesis permease subunit
VAKKLKLYEKAGRVIRLLAWISGIFVLAIAAATLIPLFANRQQAEAGPLVVVVIVLALIALFVYFQLALGAATSDMKHGDGRLGLDMVSSCCSVSLLAPSSALIAFTALSKDGISKSSVGAQGALY